MCGQIRHLFGVETEAPTASSADRKHRRMAPISLLLLWPLRKAAVIPAALLSSLALGAAFGSFDLARKGTRLLLPHSTSKRSGTDAVAAASAATVAGGMLTLRELLFAPRAVPLPALRVDGAAQHLGERLRNASVLFLVRRHMS